MKVANYSKKVPGLKPGPKTLAKQREMALRKPALEYSIVLLLDASGSMEGEKIRDAKEALISFLEDIELTKNEVGLVAFGKSVWAGRLTQNRAHLEMRIKNLEAGGGTPMKRAIKMAYENILKKGNANPVMVIATDGQPTDASKEEIIEYATPIKQDGTLIITIGIGSGVNKEFLKMLASTPKDYLFAKASFELKKLYKKVSAGLAVREEPSKKGGITYGLR